MRGICSWIFVLSVSLLVSGGCDIQKGRFATCETDDDCKSADASKPYCWNLRCVGCAYDRHCQDGEICNRKARSCVRLD